MPWILLIGALLCTNILLASESVRGPHIKVSWVAPGELSLQGPNFVGIHFEPEKDWHIYWKNPGDSGTAPKFDFTSEGAELGPIQWPTPTRIPFGHLMNIGYEGSVVFPFSLDVQDGAKVTLAVEMEWLVCKIECVPGFGRLTLVRSVRSGPALWSTSNETLMENSLKKIPTSVNDSPWVIQNLIEEDQHVKIRLQGKIENSETVDIFPADVNYLSAQSPQILGTTEGLEVTFSKVPGAVRPETLNLVLSQQKNAWDVPAYSFAATAMPSAVTEDFWIYLLSALLGGLILNLMPCVFPVISIKILSLVKAGGSAKKIRSEGLLYTLGVLFTFVALGSVFLLLRQAGSEIGWGFHLQSPVVILFLIFLFWLAALNLAGYFQMGDSLMNWAGASKWSRQSSSFASGVLSVFVAAPCTGPFMGSVLGASVTLPAAPAMLLFLSLGLGLALPFLLLSFYPQALVRMPAPGRWMEKLKEFLSFPLFATVLWLIWVLAQQLGEEAWLLVGSLLLACVFLIWWGKHSGKKIKVLLWILALGGFAYAVHQVSIIESEDVLASEKKTWVPFDPALIAKRRAEGGRVFIDFTASWCITCQWNKKAVLDKPDINQLFQDQKVLTVRADWTHQDPQITKALGDLGRNSVPVYVYYNERGYRILPQILTAGHIEELFKDSKEEK